MMRLLYGIGMGGNWGVGTSLTMESVPARLHGLLSGLLQEGYVTGYLLAALAYWVVFPRWAVIAPLFFIGHIPALLGLFIFNKVKETEAWRQNRTDWHSYGRAITLKWRRLLYIWYCSVSVYELYGARNSGHVPPTSSASCTARRPRLRLSPWFRCWGRSTGDFWRTYVGPRGQTALIGDLRRPGFRGDPTLDVGLTNAVVALFGAFLTRVPIPFWCRAPGE